MAKPFGYSEFVKVNLPHTSALEYSLWERIHFYIFGRWPARVVERRLAALEADESHKPIIWPGHVARDRPSAVEPRDDG